MLLALLISLTPGAVLMTAGRNNVQPTLLQAAAQAPDQLVRVIVQMQDVTKSLDARVRQLGGEILHELSIINAIVVELPAGAVPELATASNVRWISLDGPVERSGVSLKKSGNKKSGNKKSATDQNYFLDTLGVRDVWQMGIDGSGIGVAIIDSGVSPSLDLNPKRNLSFNPNATATNDFYGHGTHVAGIVAGNGSMSGQAYTGIAPGVSIFSLRISDDTGMAYESDTVAAMQWVLDNKDAYNIRVVNLSINSTQEMSYHLSPLDAAAEILWFNGIVVVASAGNKGHSGNNSISGAPANDPFIITVGAANEHGTVDVNDDTVASFSAYGTTSDGYFKPDIVAPGQDIISLLSSQSSWGNLYPDRLVDGSYFRLSGTSMAAPMVTGAVALLLQDEPNLTPDQVKYRLTHANTIWLKDSANNDNPYLDVYAAVTGNTTQSANTGLVASQLLWTGSDPIQWSSVNWNSVNWNSVNWNSVNWNSVNWNSVNWNSVDWNN
jgi:serine protease AprX